MKVLYKLGAVTTVNNRVQICILEMGTRMKMMYRK